MEIKVIIGLTLAIFSSLCVVGLIVWACVDIRKHLYVKRYRGGVGRDWK